MRKKSHISLARYIVANTKDEELKKHKLSFYIGSILPDCKPSFVYKRHEISGTFPLVKKNIEYLVEGKKNHTPKRKRMYYKNLGEITHYVADYFTFPHNKTYPGSLKDHCAYEEKLKQDLRAFLKTEKAKQIGREKDHNLSEKLCTGKHWKLLGFSLCKFWVILMDCSRVNNQLNTRNNILCFLSIEYGSTLGCKDVC